MKLIPTPESELGGGLDLPGAPGHEALVHAVVLPLQVEDLQCLHVDGDPAPAPAQRHSVLLPGDGGAVPLLREALHEDQSEVSVVSQSAASIYLHVRLSTNVNNLLRRDQI